MQPGVERMIMIIASVVAVVLQIFLAPHIAIGNAMPSFPVVLCMVVAILKSRTYGCVLPFVMGLICDLLGGTPIGAMAFSLTVFSMLTAWFYQRIDNDTIFIALLCIAVGLLLVQLCFGVILLIFGYGTNPIEAIGLKVLPSYLYNLILTLILYIIAARLVAHGDTSEPMVGRLS